MSRRDGNVGATYQFSSNARQLTTYAESERSINLSNRSQTTRNRQFIAIEQLQGEPTLEWRTFVRGQCGQ